MTEQEWLNCADPRPMLRFLNGKVSNRKLRLFAVACCWSIWHLLTDARSQRAVETAERYADGKATEAELNSAWNAMREAVAASAMAAARDAVTASATAAAWCVNTAVSWAAWHADETINQAIFVRDIFNPWLTPMIPLAWLTWHDGLPVSMAWRMYDTRDFADMPVLADGLEEAGCQDQDILGHCRSGGEHVRGCWLLDLLMGKS